MKRIISLLFCILIIFGLLLPVSAQPENTAVVLDFLVAPSQYTNQNNFGLNIENTINGKSAVTSLGNFGGYVIYRFSQPILNSDKNPYGIDFIINGNAFNGSAGAAEPGQVWVSQNGIDWYALAGSEHYENETLWDYSVTYIKPENYTNKCDYVDSLGDSGAVSTVTASHYPDFSLYPKAAIPENNLTLSGILLKKSRVPSTAVVVETQFGYVDAKQASNSDIAVNPYLSDPVNNCKDGQFDISWAVDKNGFGVHLESVNYIKVQCATFIESSVFGEKSTEISKVMIAKSCENKTEVTPAPKSITLNGTKLDLSSGENNFSVPVESDTPFDVSVQSDANVYINNTRTSLKHFNSTTNKGVVRIIVQKDELQPLIYYINTGASAIKATVNMVQKELTAKVGDIISLDASSSDGCELKWSSSDESVAIIENGRVIILSEGSAVIKAENKDGAFASCVITAFKADDNSPENSCTHICHKSGFMGFIWKIINFFNKIFKKNEFCTCGISHR